MVMGRAHAVYRPVVLYLFMFVILCCTTYKLSKMPSKTTGLGLETFFVGSRPVPINSTTSRVGKPKSAIVSVPFGLKVHLSLKIFKLLLAAQLIVLSGDVMLNPGPLHSDLSVLRSDLTSVMKAFHLLIAKATAMSHLQVNSTRQWTHLMTLNLICILTWIYRAKA